MKIRSQCTHGNVLRLILDMYRNKDIFRKWDIFGIRDIHGGQTKFPDLVFATQWSNEGFKFTSFIWGNFYGSFAITRT